MAVVISGGTMARMTGEGTARTPQSSGDPIKRLESACAGIREAVRGIPRRGIRHDDVDDSIGTFNTDDAIDFDPFPMLALMQESGADYAVFGQVAGIMHGSQEPTGDLDILWDPVGSDISKMEQVFQGVQLLSFRADNHQAITDIEFGLTLPKLYFEGLGCAGDLCTPLLPWGGLDVRTILGRKIWAHSSSLSVPYIDLEDLIEMRRVVGGTKHVRRARELEMLLGRSGD